MGKDRQPPVCRNCQEVFYKPSYPNPSLMFALIDRGNIADQKSPGYCRAEWRAFRSSQFSAFALTQGFRFSLQEFANGAAVTVTFVIDVVDDCSHLFEVLPAINRKVAEDNSAYGK